MLVLIYGRIFLVFGLGNPKATSKFIAHSRNARGLSPTNRNTSMEEPVELVPDPRLTTE